MKYEVKCVNKPKKCTKIIMLMKNKKEKEEKKETRNREREKEKKIVAKAF